MKALPKKSRKVGLIFLSLFLNSLLGAPALLAQKPTAFAVVDIQRAMLETSDGRKATEALQAKVLPRRAEFETRQRDLEAELQRVNDDQSIAEDKREELTQSLQRKQKRLEREEMEAEEQLEEEENRLIDKISPLFVKVLEKYANEHQYALVFDISDAHNPVLWASETVDLTKIITASYDEAALQPQTSSPAQPPKSDTTNNAAKPRLPAPTTPKPN